jgi:ribosomal protein S18 acetylase RimI-like enzyme
MRNIFLNNLSELHQLLGGFSGASVGHSNQLSWVLCKPNHWPDSVIGNPGIDGIQEVADKMEIGLLPPFLVVPLSEIEEQLPLFRQNGLREVFRWEAMSLKSADFCPCNEIIKGYEVKSVDDEQILNDWIGIIKQVLMQNKIISEQVLNGMFQHPDVTLMVGYFNNQPVSAGMVFVREGVAGLYFIATLSEYQRRGLGAVLVSRLIQDSFSKGANEIILQSSVAGKKLYLKLGFIPEGEISVFWKLGKY